MRWASVPLADAFWFQEGPGIRKWQFTDHGIKLLNVANILKSGVLNLENTNRYLDANEVTKKYSHFLVDAGDLVIASSGISIEEDGLLRTRGAFVSSDHLPLCMNTSTIRFKANAGVSYLPYLKQWLDSSEFRQQITKEVTGIAQKNFGPSHLKRLQITLPPLPAQKKIAAILDAADALRAKRRESIEQLDALVQATFLEMFGDPVTNPKGWEIARLGDLIAEGPQNGLYKPAQAYGAGVRILRIDGFYGGEMEPETGLKRVRVTEVEQQKYALKCGDVVINRVNSRSHLGKCALIPKLDETVIYESNMMRLRLATEKMNGRYAVQLLQSPLVKSQILRQAKDAVNQSSINQTDIRGLSVVVPPFSLQTRFASIVESIEQQKTRLKAHLTELDSLFASLQSRAFNGELVA